MSSSSDNIFANLAESLLPVEQLVTASAYVIGVLFAMRAVYSLKVYGEARAMTASNSSIKEPVIYLISAGVLIYFPTGFEVFMNTMFGYSDVLAYGSSGSAASIFGTNSAAGYTLTLVIQIVGVVAFVRGWVLVARSAAQGQPPGGTGKGLVHVFGGVLAMNIVGTLEVIINTLYGT